MTAPFSSGAARFIQPVATAGSSSVTVVRIAPYDGVVSSVTFVPVAAITGANTNTRQIQLINKGSNGAGTTVVATLQFNLATDAVALVSKAVTLSGTPANLVVAAGDVLVWASNAIGTGQADPGGLATVSISPRYA
jgi:hypothetical protein